MKMLYIVRGLPGSGKTTYAERKALELGGIVAEADQFMVNDAGNYTFDPSRLPEVHGKCQNKVKSCMGEGVDNIFVANTSSQYWEIEPYIKLAKQFGYAVMIEELWTQYGNIHDVPESSVQAMVKSWEDPDKLKEKIQKEGVKILGFLIKDYINFLKNRGVKKND